MKYVTILAFCLAAVLAASTAAACPMASKDGRFVLLQSSLEGLNGGWVLNRAVHDLSKAPTDKKRIVYTSEAFSKERPDLDYLPRSLRAALKPYKIVTTCLKPSKPSGMRATLVASGASCKLRVSKGSKSVMTRPLELDEEAIHGADACASTPEMVWTLLPSGAVLLKVKLWEEDPAMGKMLLGQDIFILPPM